MIRTGAQAAALALVKLSVADLTGVLGWRPMASLYHLGLGLLFAFADFLERDSMLVRWMVGGLGVLLVVVKTVTIATPLA